MRARSTNNKTIDLKHPTLYHSKPRGNPRRLFARLEARSTAAPLARALQVNPEAEGVLSRRLNAMERDGQIAPNRRPVCADGPLQLHFGPHQRPPRRLRLRDPGEGGEDLFLPDKEMQKVLHGDRVLARVIGTDRRGRPEGTIVEVVERANTHIIGRLLNENGVWVVAPEDKRIGQDVLVSGSPGKAKAGQVVSIELIEQPSRFRQPTGKHRRSAGRTRRSGHGNRNRGAQVRRAAHLLASRDQAGEQAAERSARDGPRRTRRPARRAAGDDRRRRRARLRRCRLLRTGEDRPQQGLPPAGGDRRRQQLRQAGRRRSIPMRSSAPPRCISRAA
jgi:hypothetical protein